MTDADRQPDGARGEGDGEGADPMPAALARQIRERPTPLPSAISARVVARAARRRGRRRAPVVLLHRWPWAVAAAAALAFGVVVWRSADDGAAKAGSTSQTLEAEAPDDHALLTEVDRRLASAWDCVAEARPAKRADDTWGMSETLDGRLSRARSLAASLRTAAQGDFAVFSVGTAPASSGPRSHLNRNSTRQREET